MECFLNVHFGCLVGSTTLQQAQFDSAHLNTEAFFDKISKKGGESAQLRMTESIGSGSFCFGYETSICIMDAFGNYNKDLAFFIVDFFNVCKELIHIKVHFRKID